MPTGSGKTLVGILLGEWRRRTFGERLLYLTPTKQLAFQVANEARDKYDIRVVPLVGPKASFPRNDQAAWEASDVLAVTTYSALFNTNPAFRDPQIIVVDDAHAAENYFAGYWTLSIRKEDHPVLWMAMSALLREHLPQLQHRRLVEAPKWPDDLTWVDKLPTPTLYEIANSITSILDENIVHRSDEWYSWSVLRSNIRACHLYISATEITLRPLIAPTWSHGPFAEAKQRIYMSATLGQGGDLERLTGRRTIHRIPIPETWERQGLGRRLFLFPARSMSEKWEESLLPSLARQVERCTVLVPSSRRAEHTANILKTKLGFTIFSADVIEQTKERFVTSTKAAAVLANRYDGIDFPGDECRLLVVDGMPRAVNLQEKFLMSRMSAAILLNDRMMTRIVQAFGRCTRSATDYACVVVGGSEITNMLLRREKRSLLHPELQAEIEFGLDQSADAKEPDYSSYLQAFLEQGAEWYDAGEVQIQGIRASATQVPMDCASELAAAVPYEIDYQERIWSGDYDGAIDAARRVLSELKDDKLRGYRALWNYLAGSAAFLATSEGGRALESTSKDFFWSASRESSGIPWLKALARYSASHVSESGPVIRDGMILERLESMIEDFGMVSDNKLVKYEKQVREGLAQSKKGPFESAHENLGRLLGYQAGNKETPGAPDPWWIVDESLCIIFEDHSDAKSSSLDVTKARQVASHPKWVRENLKLAPNAEVVPVLVSPVTAADTDSLPHIGDVCFWSLDDFRQWSERAMRAFRQIRTIYPGNPGDIVWRAEARAILHREGVDLATLLEQLRASNARHKLQPQS
jgi:hypothetical protein